MEPRIQYTKTEDGVNITDAIEGDWPPRICLAVEEADLASWTSCVAGALRFVEYTPLLASVGFANPSITFRQVAEQGYASAYVTAEKPK